MPETGSVQASSAPDRATPRLPDPGPPGLVGWLPFVAAVTVVTILGATGVLPRWAGLVHAVAPPPLDLAFDLRLMVARTPSYGELVLGVASSVLIRALILASLLDALGDERSLGRRFTSALGFYGIALVPLGLAAALEFAGLAAVYSWYAWAGVALALLVAIRMMPRAVGAARFRTALWALAALAGLGALAQIGGGVAPVALVPVSGVLTGVALRRMRKPSPMPRSTVPALALAAAVIVAGTHAVSSPITSVTTLFLVPGVDTSSGHGAMYLFRPGRLGIECDRVFYFSYRGPGPGAPQGEAACPIRRHARYETAETQRPLGELVDAFARQVARIRTKTGGAPVAVVTHSQGAVIAWAAVAAGRAEGVSHLISLAGFPNSPVGYPPPGRDGEGRLGADALRALSAMFRGLGSGNFSPDAPLAREILARPDGLEDVFAQPLPPSVTAATISTSFDVVAAPEGSRIPGVPATTVDATHVGVIDAEGTFTAVGAVLRGDRPSPRSVLGRVLEVVLPAFMPPPAGI